MLPVYFNFYSVAERFEKDHYIKFHAQCSGFSPFPTSHIIKWNKSTHKVGTPDSTFHSVLSFVCFLMKHLRQPHEGSYTDDATLRIFDHHQLKLTNGSDRPEKDRVKTKKVECTRIKSSPPE